LMGFAASPYNSIKMALVAKEVCKGNRLETGVGVDKKEDPIPGRTLDRGRGGGELKL